MTFSRRCRKTLAATLVVAVGSQLLALAGFAQEPADLRAECRSQALTRFDPGNVDRPLTWRDKTTETYVLRMQPNEAGDFAGRATFIPSNGEASEYAARFNWRAASLFLDDPETGFPHLLMRLVNTGAGPVFDALAMKPARSGPQIIRYSCSFTCNDRPLRNLLDTSCPVTRP
tara:strand:- start:8972 stop:9490 length:519 start_codon:yes stop_codon:yes gene_type:complete